MASGFRSVQKESRYLDNFGYTLQKSISTFLTCKKKKKTYKKNKNTTRLILYSFQLSSTVNIFHFFFYFSAIIKSLKCFWSFASLQI